MVQPDFDVRNMVNAFLNEVPFELDFNVEAENLRQAGKNFELSHSENASSSPGDPWGTAVRVPLPPPLLFFSVLSFVTCVFRLPQMVGPGSFNTRYKNPRQF